MQEKYAKSNPSTTKSRIRRNGLDWDTRIESLCFEDDDILNKKKVEILRLWNKFSKEIGNLKDFCIPRWIFENQAPPNGSVIVKQQLICFSDAGLYLIACMIYLRVVYDCGFVSMGLICTKSRVRNGISIERAELIGLLDSCTLCKKVRNVIDIPLEDCIFYVDSSIVFYWIKTCE